MIQKIGFCHFKHIGQLVTVDGLNKMKPDGDYFWNSTFLVWKVNSLRNSNFWCHQNLIILSCVECSQNYVVKISMVGQFRVFVDYVRTRDLYLGLKVTLTPKWGHVMHKRRLPLFTDNFSQIKIRGLEAFFMYFLCIFLCIFYCPRKYTLSMNNNNLYFGRVLFSSKMIRLRNGVLIEYLWGTISNSAPRGKHGTTKSKQELVSSEQKSSLVTNPNWTRSNPSKSLLLLSNSPPSMFIVIALRCDTANMLWLRDPQPKIK